ncbi:MAG: ABC transporter permease [Clostridia bacterium]|nr:ABC transporter permease [Clostridia bacterium]
MLAIFKREMRSYFTTATGYIFLAVSLALLGAMFGATTFLQATSEAGTYFLFMLAILVIILPILTMKTFSEERRTKTDQLLLTAPVPVTKMVLGKYLAAFTMFMIVVLLSMLNYIPLSAYAVEDAYGSTSSPNFVMILGSTFAIILVGMCFIAIGMFISSLTENQFAAIVITLGVLAALLCISIFNSFISSSAVRAILDWFSVYSRFYNFTYGLFDFGALIYYLSVAGVFVFLTIRVFIARRFR